MNCSTQGLERRRWHHSLRYCMVILLTSLAACGGGSSSSPPPGPTTPPPPTIIASTLVTSVAPFTGADTDKIKAYTNLNAIRGTCGFGLLAQNAQLETSAANHANYLGVNFLTHPDSQSHVENPAYPGFTGVTFADRDRFAGYAFQNGTEEFGPAFTSATTQADVVQGLTTVGYHLAGLVGSGYLDIGIASAVLGSGPGQTPTTASDVVLELGAKTVVLQDISSADVSTYPCAGQTVKVNSRGIGHEVPEPFPGRDYSAKPLGQPIYVRVRVGQTLAITSVTMVSASGTTVPQAALLTNANDPNKMLGVNEALFYPDGALAAGTTYTVTITGTNNGTAFTRTEVAPLL